MLRVLITNIKGGCGKTTIATNLAAAFAAGGFITALAEVDRQRSSLSWLKLRNGQSRPIQGLDWRKEVGDTPPDLRRLVIDAPANLRMRHVDDLISEADLVVVPVLASVFDEGSTEHFLAKLDELKPIRKGRKTRGPGRQPAAAALEGSAATRDFSRAARPADRREAQRPRDLWRTRRAGLEHLRHRWPVGAPGARRVAAAAQYHRGDRLSGHWRLPP